MNKKKVLVTYGWCRTSYVAVKSLSRAGFEVYVCDSNTMAMSRFSRYTTGFFKVSPPFENPTQYYKDIANLCEKHKIDYVLPVHEEGVFLKNKSVDSTFYKKVVYSEKKNIEKALDKFEIMNIASDAGLNVPKTYHISSHAEAIHTIESLLQTFGSVIIKPRWGNSGKGVHLIQNLNDAEIALEQYYAAYKNSNSPFPLVQEYVKGSIYGACFLAIEGEIKYFFGEKYIRSKSNGMGTSVLREPCHWQQLEAEARKLVSSLNWDGLGHLDFIGDGKTHIHFLEMNPRLWGGIHNSIANGFDFPAAIIAYADNQPSLQKYFTHKDNSMEYKSMWILGELISIVDDIKIGGIKKTKAGLKEVFKHKNISYDDFCIRDPLPFFVQCLYYLKEFLKSGGNVNPDRPDMM
jgi:carbamoyl-phosphate synthase large subunit